MFICEKFHIQLLLFISSIFIIYRAVDKPSASMHDVSVNTEIDATLDMMGYPVNGLIS